jgi:hypothetical protein
MWDEVIVPVLHHYVCICHEELGKTTESLNEISQFSGRDMKSGPTEQEIEFRAAEPRHSLVTSRHKVATK